MKFKLSIFFAFFLGTISAQAQSITNFSNVADFTVTFSDFATTTPSGSGLFISGTDENFFFGTTQTVVVGTPSGLSLTATQTTSLTTPFTIQMFDSADNSVNYTSSWVVSASPVVYNLTFAGQDSGNTSNFNGTVTRVGFATGGLGTALTLNLTNLSVSAIPEPSTFAAFAGLAALGLCAGRRRRRI